MKRVLLSFILGLMIFLCGSSKKEKKTEKLVFYAGLMEEACSFNNAKI